MKLALLPTCLQCYLTELFLKVVFICWCQFITDMIVYTYAEFGMNCLKNKWNITHCSACCVVSLLQYSIPLYCRSSRYNPNLPASLSPEHQMLSAPGWTQVWFISLLLVQALLYLPTLLWQDLLFVHHHHCLVLWIQHVTIFTRKLLATLTHTSHLRYSLMVYSLPVVRLEWTG